MSAIRQQISVFLLAAVCWCGMSPSCGVAQSSSQPQSSLTNSNNSQPAIQMVNGIPAFGGTGGQIRILSGTGNFASVSDANNTLNVSPGAALNGTVQLSVLNLCPAANNAVAPLIYTPSWGEHSNSWRQINAWVPSGQSQQQAQISLTAPTAPGTYYIIFAVSWEVGGDHVASGTTWSIGKDLGYGWVNTYDIWNDGHDLADFNAAQLSSAQSNGWAYVNVLSSVSPKQYTQRPMPADAITLVVSANGSTQPTQNAGQTTTSTSSGTPVMTAFTVPEDAWGAVNTSVPILAPNGSCFAFATVELTWFNMRLSQPSLSRLQSVYMNCDAGMQTYLTPLIQLLSQPQNSATFGLTTVANDVCSGLESELKAGHPAMIVMRGVSGGKNEGHAVVAIGYVETTTSVIFSNADSNVPGTAQTLTYDKSTQTWNYYWTASPYNWTQFKVDYFTLTGFLGSAIFSADQINGVQQFVNALLPASSVQTVTPAQTSVAVNQTFPVTVAVKNTGPSAGNFDIRLVDPALLGGWPVATSVQANQSFNAGQTLPFTFSVTATSAGTHNLLGQACVHGSLSEDVDWVGANGMKSADVVASSDASTSSQSPSASQTTTPSEPAAPLPPVGPKFP
jgi:hypothetical protein